MDRGGFMTKQTDAKPPLVKANCGSLEGIRIRTRGKDDIAAFLGVPFAQPPVGDLRWREPQPLPRWTGTRRAGSFGPACSQVTGGGDLFRATIAKAFGINPPKLRRVKFSEDCLYLNIFTESPYRQAKRPVMVWIHGGSFLHGTGAHYDMRRLVRKGVVAVTINYRLGVLGFLPHPELTAESPQGASGNYGILDQIEALWWVKRNIASFGGDPDNVTIFGESAGGQSVTQLMISPPAAGLFHRAISESGVGLHVHTTLDAAEERGAAFAKSVGAADLEALRSIKADLLISAATAFQGVTGPIIDGYTIAEHPVCSFSTGRFHRVPFILGSNGDEGTALYWGSPMLEIPPPVDSVGKYRSAIRRIFDADANKVLKAYPAVDDDEMVASSKDLLGDSLFGAQAYYVAKQMAKFFRLAYTGEWSLNGNPPYLYFFSRKPAGKAGKILGAFHGSEISYVLGITVFGILSKDDLRMSDTIIGYWVRFARTGNPNEPDSASWGRFDLKKNQYMEFDKTAAMTNISRMSKYRLFEN